MNNFRPLLLYEKPTLEMKPCYSGSTCQRVWLHDLHFLLQGNQYTCNLHSSRCCLDAIWHFNSCLVLFYCCFFSPTHITPPYCFHSNAITEMTAFSCCYHSSLSSVHIWRLSSSRERCSLQQIANCGAGSGCMCLLHGASLRTTLS